MGRTCRQETFSTEAKHLGKPEKEEEPRAKEGEVTSSQAATKEARHALKERRQALEASKGHYEEGSDAWLVLEQLIKKADQEIEQNASPQHPQHMPYPQNGCKKCVQQLRTAKAEREVAQKEVDKLQKELDSQKAFLETKEVVLRAAESVVARAHATVQSGSAQRRPRQVAFPPEAPVVTTSAKEVNVDLCAKLPHLRLLRGPRWEVREVCGRLEAGGGPERGTYGDAGGLGAENGGRITHGDGKNGKARKDSEVGRARRRGARGRRGTRYLGLILLVTMITGTLAGRQQADERLGKPREKDLATVCEAARKKTENLKGKEPGKPKCKRTRRGAAENEDAKEGNTENGVKGPKGKGEEKSTQGRQEARTPKKLRKEARPRKGESPGPEVDTTAEVKRRRRNS